MKTSRKVSTDAYTEGTMTFTMNDRHLVTVSQLKAFVRASDPLIFSSASRVEKYAWIEKILNRFFYFSLKKRDKMTVKQFIIKTSGYSDAQLTRLIAEKKETKKLMASSSSKRSRFSTKYSTSDVALLVATDHAHECLSGNATKKLFERSFFLFHDHGYERLKDISVAHIYNLRKRRQYQSGVSFFTKTNPTTVPLGRRTKPFPQGKPGYIRVDSVHQGDKGKEKGVYHINCVDEVTQWELVGCVERISEEFLLPLLERLITQFPFRVIEFHSDNGSEYINYRVAALLQQLMIDQSKSRPRKCNDNALVEGKNGSIIRKHMGYAHIPQRHASRINIFYQNYFNEYVNYHRPSGYATITITAKGKEKKKYDIYETPYEHLKKIPNAATFLREENSFLEMEKTAIMKSDFACATVMQKEKTKLFNTFG